MVGLGAGPALTRALIILALLAALALGYGRWEKHHQLVGYQRAVAEYAAQAEQAAADAAKETQRRLARQKENDDAHAKQLEKLALDATAATAAAGRLRGQVAALLAASRTKHPATEPGGETTGSAVDLLAELLSESDSRTGELGAALDASYAAGRLCEAQYDALSR